MVGYYCRCGCSTGTSTQVRVPAPYISMEGSHVYKSSAGNFISRTAKLKISTHKACVPLSAVHYAQGMASWSSIKVLTKAKEMVHYKSADVKKSPYLSPSDITEFKCSLLGGVHMWSKNENRKSVAHISHFLLRRSHSHILEHEWSSSSISIHMYVATWLPCGR